MLPCARVQAHVVQRVDEAQVGELLVAPGDGGVGGLDVQVGHVIGQDRHLVGVQLLAVLALELLVLPAKVLQQLADEGARAGGRVQDLHVAIDQALAEVLLAQPIGTVDHEAHDLVGRVDHAQPVCRLGVVDLVEVLVDHLQEGLLLGVAADLRRRAADGGVVGLKSLERGLLQAAGEEGFLQAVQLVGDVVLAVEVAVVEDLGEDLFRQHMLDQHFAHVGLGEAGVDGLLRMLQELARGLAEGGVLAELAFDHLAQGGQHFGQIGLELLDGLAKAGDFGPLVAEEELEQLLQLRHVGDVAAHHLLAVLDQHGLAAVLEDDVVLRVATLELGGDLGVQVVGLVLGLPVAEGNAQLVQQCAVHVTPFLGGGVEFVLRHEDQVVLATPGLEQVLERLAQHRLAPAAAHLAQAVELGEVLADQGLAQGALPVFFCTKGFQHIDTQGFARPR